MKEIWTQAETGEILYNPLAHTHHASVCSGSYHFYNQWYWLCSTVEGSCCLQYIHLLCFILTDCQSIAIIIVLLLQCESVTSWKLASPSWSIHHEIFVDQDENKVHFRAGVTQAFSRKLMQRAQLQLWIQSCLCATVHVCLTRVQYMHIQSHTAADGSHFQNDLKGQQSTNPVNAPEWKLVVQMTS